MSKVKSLTELMSIKRSIHFIGIGGCGMSAIAKVLLALNYKVSGSDMKESANTIRLRELGAEVFIDHEAINLRSAQVVVVSAAIKETNPELTEARASRLPIFERAQMLGYLMSLSKKSIAVAGTHGKTTTSSMVSVVLNKAGVDPTYLIGGDVLNLGTNGDYGRSDYFVAEADESDGSIKYLDPQIFVLTNIEKDHLDHFKDLDAIIDLFENCLEKLSQKNNSLLVIDADQWGNQILLKKIQGKYPLNIITYGLSENVQVRAVNIKYKGNGSTYTLIKDNNVIGEVELSVPGEHNVLNSLAVATVGLSLGLDLNKLKVGLSSFTGAKRRFMLVGQSKGVKVYDDYAHHPTEIAATLKAARLVYPKSRIVAVFQPHRYSRTMFFLPEFGESLNLADLAVVTNVYSAGEAPIPGVQAKDILKTIDKNKGHYFDKKEDIADYLLNELEDGDVLFTLGAGDINNIGKEILNRIKTKNSNKKDHAGKIIRIA